MRLLAKRAWKKLALVGCLVGWCIGRPVGQSVDGRVGEWGVYICHHYRDPSHISNAIFCF